MEYTTLPKPETKTGRVLAALLSGREITRFDAERELHDHVLNTTVSILSRVHGVTISRKRITVPGYQDIPTPCCLYWIEPEEIGLCLEHIAWLEEIGLMLSDSNVIFERSNMTQLEKGNSLIRGILNNVKFQG